MRHKKCSFEYESFDETQHLKNVVVMTPLSQMGQDLSSINNWFSKLSERNEIYGFIQNLDSFLNAVKSGNLNEQCKWFHKKMGDIELEELSQEIKKFALIHNVECLSNLQIKRLWAILN